MAKAIKDYYDLKLAKKLADQLSSVDSTFSTPIFLRKIKGIKTKELKDRLTLFAECFHQAFSEDYLHALSAFQKILGEPLQSTDGMFNQGYHLYPVSQYVEKYGLPHTKESIEFIYELTQRFTGEFCIRPFLQADPVNIQKKMLKWSGDKNVHVRRFSSEGLRPRLPWAAKFDGFIEDPSPAFAVLKKLRGDSEKYVQKSVANHLRDYLKLNLQASLPLAESWAGENNEITNSILRHALRPKIETSEKKLQPRLKKLIQQYRG